MGSLSHAQRELDILVKSHQDPENRPLIEDFIPEILALVKKFGESGQSGGSAPYTAKALSQAIEHLCLQEPICPIMGIDDEWCDISEISCEPKGTLYQNNRDSAVFKEVLDGGKERCYYIDAIIKVTPDNVPWNGPFWLSKEDYLTGDVSLMIRPTGYIKSFPFTPKTFYVDVIEEEVTPDEWEMYLKDPKQLDEVLEYYKIDHPYFNRKKKLEKILGLK